MRRIMALSFAVVLVATVTATGAGAATGVTVDPVYIDPGGYGPQNGDGGSYGDGPHPEWPNDGPTPQGGDGAYSDSYWEHTDPEDFGWTNPSPQPSCTNVCWWNRNG